MKFYSILAFLFVQFLVTDIQAQNFWREVEELEMTQRDFPKSDLPDFPMEIYALEFNEIKEYLVNTPEEFSGLQGKKLSIPVSDKGIVEFDVFTTTVMEKELADKYPQIRSFVGKDAKGNVAHMGYDTRGFYANMIVDGETYVVESYNNSNTSIYSTFKKNDFPTDLWETFSCDNQDHDHENDFISERLQSRSDNAPVDLKTYRIAIAATTQYASRFGGTIEGVIEEMNRLVNRVNLIFRNDLAATLVIIAKNESLIDLSTMFYSNGNTGLMIDENPRYFQIKGIKTDEFDVGHVLGTNGGGLAQLYSLCTTNDSGWQKARGVSTWANVFGDPFHVNVVAHELGHQFGTPHSFNNCNYGGNASESTGFEPGSGHTIMSYHGLCREDNTAGASLDKYNFHALNVIYEHMTEGGASECGTRNENVNTRPSVSIDIPDGFAIPRGTPFKLVGEAFDHETPELITYSWEQANFGPKARLGEPMGSAPMFRVMPSSPSPVRFFPNMVDLLSGNQTREEVLPNYSRPMDFRLVVRDNDPTAGAFGQAHISFEATENAGPFVVMTQMGGRTLIEGETLLVEWDVANTNIAPVNCKVINILASNDGGKTFVTLAENVLNTGLVEIEVPKLNMNSCRLFVEAADNIFFNVAEGVFSIKEAEESTLSFIPESFGYQVCTPDIIDIPFNVKSIGGFDGTGNVTLLTPDSEGVYASLNKNSVTADDEVVLQIQFSEEAPVSGILSYEVELVTSQEDTILRTIYFDLSSAIPHGVESITPADGATQIQGNPLISWSHSDYLSSYNFRLRSLDGSIDINFETQDSFIQFQNALPVATVFYWTVSLNNRCSVQDKDFTVFSFTTINSNCNLYEPAEDVLPMNLSVGAPNVKEFEILIPETTVVSDINIPVFVGSHGNVKELKTTLVSPTGVEAILFNDICSSRATMNYSFDDNLTTTFNCNPDGVPRRTQYGELVNLTGVSGGGVWKVRIEDFQFGNGGRMSEFQLELCGTFEVDHPKLETNNPLNVPTLQHQVITNEYLACNEDNHASDDLRYILLDLPKKGYISNYSLPIEQNGYFTQSSINDFGVVYHHTGSPNDRFDSFRFIVIDGAGGYYGTGVFNIVIDQEFVVSNNETIENLDFKIYPNPGNGMFTIQSSSNIKEAVVEVYMLDGRLGYQKKYDYVGGNIQLDLTNLPSGVYFVKMNNESSSGIQKLIIAK